MLGRDLGTNILAQHATSADPLEEARFIPQRYEPNYPYPLLVLLHGRGSDEQRLIGSVPGLSWRNYVGLSLRGPQRLVRGERVVGFGWGEEFRHPEKARLRPDDVESLANSARLSDPERFGRSISQGFREPIDAIEDGVFESVRKARRTLHIHSERIFLVGLGEGAAVALRLGLTHPERFAGVVAIHGWVPAGFRPLARIHECRSLRIFSLHGEWNSSTVLNRARRDASLLEAAGLDVAYQSYPCANRMTSRMLNDVDNWLMRQCGAASP